MKSDSFLLKKAINLDENLFLFLSSSNCNLLEDINAISTPEKKAENSREKIAIFNKANHLELSIYKSNPLTVGSASTLFGLYFRDPVSIIFE